MEKQKRHFRNILTKLGYRKVLVNPTNYESETKSNRALKVAGVVAGGLTAAGLLALALKNKGKLNSLIQNKLVPTKELLTKPKTVTDTTKKIIENVRANQTTQPILPLTPKQAVIQAKGATTPETNIIQKLIKEAKGKVDKDQTTLQRTITSKINTEPKQLPPARSPDAEILKRTKKPELEIKVTNTQSSKLLPPSTIPDKLLLKRKGFNYTQKVKEIRKYALEPWDALRDLKSRIKTLSIPAVKIPKKETVRTSIKNQLHTTVESVDREANLLRRDIFKLQRELKLRLPKPLTNQSKEELLALKSKALTIKQKRDTVTSFLSEIDGQLPELDKSLEKITQQVLSSRNTGFRTIRTQFDNLTRRHKQDILRLQREVDNLPQNVSSKFYDDFANALNEKDYYKMYLTTGELKPGVLRRQALANKGLSQTQNALETFLTRHNSGMLYKRLNSTQRSFRRLERQARGVIKDSSGLRELTTKQNQLIKELQEYKQYLDDPTTIKNIEDRIQAITNKQPNLNFLKPDTAELDKRLRLNIRNNLVNIQERLNQAKKIKNTQLPPTLDDIDPAILQYAKHKSVIQSELRRTNKEYYNAQKKLTEFKNTLKEENELMGISLNSFNKYDNGSFFDDIAAIQGKHAERMKSEMYTLYDIQKMFDSFKATDFTEQSLYNQLSKVQQIVSKKALLPQEELTQMISLKDKLGSVQTKWSLDDLFQLKADQERYIRRAYTSQVRNMRKVMHQHKQELTGLYAKEKKAFDYVRGKLLSETKTTNAMVRLDKMLNNIQRDTVTDFLPNGVVSRKLNERAKQLFDEYLEVFGFDDVLAGTFKDQKIVANNIVAENIVKKRTLLLRMQESEEQLLKYLNSPELRDYKLPVYDVKRYVAGLDMSTLEKAIDYPVQNVTPDFLTKYLSKNAKLPPRRYNLTLLERIAGKTKTKNAQYTPQEQELLAKTGGVDKFITMLEEKTAVQNELNLLKVNNNSLLKTTKSKIDNLQYILRNTSIEIGKTKEGYFYIQNPPKRFDTLLDEHQYKKLVSTIGTLDNLDISQLSDSTKPTYNQIIARLRELRDKKVNIDKELYLAGFHKDAKELNYF